VHRRGALGLAAALIAAAALAAPLAEAYAPPPANAVFDYQIGGDYPPAPEVEVVSRDWFSGSPAGGGIYSICYVNGFQTQADERGADRPDEHRNWPRSLVLERLGDDPNWGGEYLVDLRSGVKRRRASRWVGQMIEGCAAKGYDAVEFDNLDSWTRFDGTPLARRVPFGRGDAVAYAELLADRTHALDLAVAQKNTVQLKPAQVAEVGFDFAIAEQCARYRECHRYRRLFGDMVIDIEYRRRDFARACETVGSELSIVLRDVGVSRPGARAYRYDAC
jgi:hypothetical protein